MEGIPVPEPMELTRPSWPGPGGDDTRFDMLDTMGIRLPDGLFGVEAPPDENCAWGTGCGVDGAGVDVAAGAGVGAGAGAGVGAGADSGAGDDTGDARAITVAGVETAVGRMVSGVTAGAGIGFVCGGCDGSGTRGMPGVSSGRRGSGSPLRAAAVADDVDDAEVAFDLAGPIDFGRLPVV